MPVRIVDSASSRDCPSLLLPLPRDQRVRIPVSVRSRSFPATIQETSSRRNRHLCHRGSHNDGHGLEIRALTSHVPCVVRNRSETAARAIHSPSLISLQSRSRNSSHRMMLNCSKRGIRHFQPMKFLSIISPKAKATVTTVAAI